MHWQNTRSYLHFLGPQVTTYTLVSLFAGFVIFIGDLALALCLQRLFTAVGLLREGTGHDLFFKIQDKYTESIILVGFGFMRIFFMWINNYARGAMLSTVETEKRAQICQIAHQNHTYSMGYLLTLYSDGVSGSAQCISNGSFAFSRIVIAIGLFVSLVYISPILSCLVVATLLALTPIQRGLHKKTTDLSKTIQSCLAQSISLLTNQIKNHLYIRIHHLGARAERELLSKLYTSLASSISYYNLMAVRTVLPQSFGLVTVALLTLMGSHTFINQPAVILSFLFLTVRFFQTLSETANVSSGIWVNIPRLKLLYAWWNENKDVLLLPSTFSEKEISLIHDPIGFSGDHLSYRYSDQIPTGIQNLNFCIEPGHVALITGPSGAGKTTLMYLLLGLNAPTSGTLTWFTQNKPPQPLLSYLPFSVSYVSSEHFLISGTIRDQIAIGLTPLPDDAHIWQILEKVGAYFVQDLPGGLDYTITDIGEGLSAGQKQRLALARALLRAPALLLLDEATANLDVDTEQQIVQTIQSLRGQATIVMITHRVPDHLNPDVHIRIEINDHTEN